MAMALPMMPNLIFLASIEAFGRACHCRGCDALVTGFDRHVNVVILMMMMMRLMMVNKNTMRMSIM